MKLSLYTIDNSYNEYLRKFDTKVQDTSFTNKKERRPFVGILITVESINYIAPLASPKPKHLKMKNSSDFIKINNGVWGAINLNNMIPVNMDLIYKINLKILPNDNSSEIKYKNLLQNQLNWCQRNSTKITNTAINLYTNIINNTSAVKLKIRCCDFKLLEQKLKEYVLSNNLCKLEQNFSSTIDINDTQKNNCNSHINKKEKTPLDTLIKNTQTKADKINSEKNLKKFNHYKISKLSK